VTEEVCRFLTLDPAPKQRRGRWATPTRTDFKADVLWQLCSWMRHLRCK